MYLIVVGTLIISYPGCATVGDDIVMKLKIVSGLRCCPYPAVICFIHQTITHGITIACSVMCIPKHYRILTIVKYTMVQHGPMTVGNYCNTNRKDINIAGKQTLRYNEVV